MTAIKICGIREPEIIDEAVRLGCDYAGLIFFPPSPRNVTLGTAAALAAHARGRIKTVAVTVDADDSLLSAIGTLVRPDFIQLHGDETPQRAAEITNALNIPIIQAIKVRTADDVALATGHTHAAMLLFDAKTPGSGQAFDWTLLQNHSISQPWFLSGGLNAGNVAEAIRATGARCVDVSSGVESAPGIKDVAKMQEFVKAMHGIPATR